LKSLGFSALNLMFARSRYFADFCQLTTRTLKGGWNQRHYNPDYLPNVHNRSKRRKLTGQIPKYVRYFFRPNRYGKQDEKVTVYDRPIWLFAIQDEFSRFIVHACLKEQPISHFTNFPYWFDTLGCYKDAFSRYGKPFSILIDGYIFQNQKKIREFLRESCSDIKPIEHPSMISSLERFFLAVQYEMRLELTQENLNSYINWYNFERPHTALNGYTPATAWLCGSETLFENYQRNTENEQDLKPLFKETERLVRLNWTDKIREKEEREIVQSEQLLAL
jgi:hypothetical protein